MPINGVHLMNVRMMVGKGHIELVEIPSDIAEAARSLKEDHQRYFEMSDTTKLIPVSALVCSRRRVQGINSALRRMTLAYAGGAPKRKPVAVTRIDSEYFLVEDGNSTTIAAMAAGWTNVPCELIDQLVDR
jgi:hypothetical protein